MFFVTWLCSASLWSRQSIFPQPIGHVISFDQFDVNGCDKSVGLKYGYFGLAAWASAMCYKANMSRVADGSRRKH